MRSQPYANRRLPVVMFVSLVLALLAPLIPVQVLAQSECHVTTDADSGPGALRDHVANPACASIYFDIPGIEGTPRTIVVESQIEIYRLLTITGPNADGSPIILSGGDQYRIFAIDVPGAEVTLDQLTITNGRAVEDRGGLGSGGQRIQGGAIFLNAGTLSITRSILENNFGVQGAAVKGWGRVVITNSIFRNNTSTAVPGYGDAWSTGGAVQLSGDYESVISHSTFSGNRAVAGGAIRNYGQDLTITGSTFSDNTSSLAGGAILYDSPDGGSLNIRSSTLSGNSGGLSGGAIAHHAGGDVSINGTTFYRNRATQGSAIVRWGDFQFSLTVTGSILGSGVSTGSLCGGNAITSGGNNLASDSMCVTGDTDLHGVDPRLDDLAPNGAAPSMHTTLTHMPLPDSPALAAIEDCSGIYSPDQRGIARPDAHCDIGAVEVRIPLLTVPDGFVEEPETSGGTVVDFAGDVSATSWLGHELAVTCDPASGTLFPVDETTTVTCTTEPDSGADHPVVSKSFDITISMAGAPTMDAPEDIVVEARGPRGAEVTFALPDARDYRQAPLDVVCRPGSGSTFPVGTTTVTCSATDDWDQPVQQTFTVTVQDTTAPALTLPEDITRTSPSLDGLVVEFTVIALDLVDGEITPDCDWQSGDLFPLGTTTVSCTATDTHGNQSAGTFTVTVLPEDNLAPTIRPQFNMTIPTTNPEGTFVTVAPSVSSPIDPSPRVVCTPPLDAFFTIGTHTITCTVTDRFGLSDSMTFQLTIVYDDGSTPPPVDPAPQEPEEPEEPEEPQEPEEPEVPVADPSAFDDVWARTDLPVASGDVSRTWIWGPQPFSTLQEVPTELWEAYAESPGGQRLVRYYDKARMEITDPAADPEATWYVTNGLLVVELITGRMQVGHDMFIELAPADVVVAGDLDDPNSPTYADLADLLDPVGSRVGAVISDRLNAGGLAEHEVVAAHYDEVTGHNIAAPFWAFMNARGLVWVDDVLSEDLLFEHPFYGTGRPVTEAYWVTVNVGGTPHDVLLQCFERRCLTYTPENPAGWQVEAGNVGLHYFVWRYGS